MPKGPRRFNAAKEVKAIARERVGTVKPARVLKPKSEKKPKYNRDLKEEENDR